MTVDEQIDKQISEELEYHRESGRKTCQRLYDGTWTTRRLKAYTRTLYHAITSVEDISFLEGYNQKLKELDAMD